MMTLTKNQIAVLNVFRKTGTATSHEIRNACRHLKSWQRIAAMSWLVGKGYVEIFPHCYALTQSAIPLMASLDGEVPQ